MSWKRTVVIVIPLLALALVTSGGVAADPVVTNGGFEMTTGTVPGQLSFNATATGWSLANPSYTFIYSPGTGDVQPGAPGQFGPVALWGPNNGSNNGLPATSPAGGNFIAQDPTIQLSPIQQTITGFTPGNHYQLSFWWAGAQQFGFDGPTTELWHVSLGSETHDTPTVMIGSHGFSGWMFETLDFTATSPTELLSFLAGGGPAVTLPPFVLLDGVSITSLAVPEPTTLSLAVTGLLGLGGFYLRRRAKAVAV